MPAKAGIHEDRVRLLLGRFPLRLPWMPAFAGMTVVETCEMRQSERTFGFSLPSQCSERRAPRPHVRPIGEMFDPCLNAGVKPGHDITC